jgi:hypothetical protein
MLMYHQCLLLVLPPRQLQLEHHMQQLPQMPSQGGIRWTNALESGVRAAAGGGNNMSALTCRCTGGLFLGNKSNERCERFVRSVVSKENNQL